MRTKLWALLTDPGDGWTIPVASKGNAAWPLVAFNNQQLQTLVDTGVELFAQGNADIRVVELTVTDTLLENLRHG